ncbi:NACHT, LRR and PYD domains-containing protein 3-like isoform X2 [Alosa sapidissima]|uniref:NACHT, LRR and PYD domains-containing protein 3-like isoform X2 n=1 Tax=Alosa sapidissima TaxID=34773 RepID=UPI001C07FA3B|nr:NACHT, LRR and PYD domains-containing protein 3-like isoform X2 [Alosa sapidissima]
MMLGKLWNWVQGTTQNQSPDTGQAFSFGNDQQQQHVVNATITAQTGARVIAPTITHCNIQSLSFTEESKGPANLDPGTVQRVLTSHKDRMLDDFDCIFEGLQQRGSKTPLNKIYTQLYIIEGESDDVNNEHEVWHTNKMSRKTDDTPIDCNDIFKALLGQKRRIRTVMTKGIAGIGKTVSVQKFILDWADGKANQEVHLLLLLPLRELNLLKNNISLHNLLLKFYPELKPLRETLYDDLQVVFILDGMDESTLPLNFQSDFVSDVTETTTLDVLVTNLIKGNLLRSARIWMTSRPAAAGQIPSEYVDRITEVHGFKKEQREEYFMKRIDDQDRAQQIFSHIKTKQSLYIMCHIPVFCYIAATVLLEMLGEYDSADIPSTLTEMYIYFLIIQLDKKKRKYDGVKPDKRNILEANRVTILRLSELAFRNLENGTVLFDEDVLKSRGMETASLQSGLCTEILREEPKFVLKPFYCFVHLSLQEFLAALFVFVSFMNEDMAALESFLKVKPKKVFLYLLLKKAVEKSLQSKNGHWDLFLRFLLGISLESSQKLLEGLLTRPLSENRKENLKSLELITKHLKGVGGKNISPDRFINLINCLSEMKDHSLQNDLQSFIYEKQQEAELSPAHCSALADALLKSEDVLDEFDIGKYNTTDDGEQRLVPVVKWCRKARLTCCNLNEQSCEIVASVLQSASSYLKELYLDSSTMPDSGLKAVCGSLTNSSCMLERLSLAGCSRTENNMFENLGSSLQSMRDSRLVDLDLSCCSCNVKAMRDLTASLMNPHCKVKRLSLRKCSLSSSHCEDLASILCSSTSSLKELDLRDNDLQDPGVELLSSGLQSSQCTLEILRLSFCGVTENGCELLASALSANPSYLRELDLSYNHPGETGVKLLSERKDDQDCKLDTFIVDHDAECWLKSGLKKYACELTLDPNTAHREISLSKDHQKLTVCEQNYPDHPDRFRKYEQVLCREGLTGRCYWEAEWDSAMMYVGAAYRKQGIKERDCRLGFNDTSWGLLCHHSSLFLNSLYRHSYTASHDRKASPKVSLTFNCNRVGVFLDWSAGTLSFYSVSSDTLTHLHTFHHRFTEPLCPGFGLDVPGISHIIGNNDSISLCRV